MTAAAKAAMTEAPKLFTSPCTISIPRFITDCCRQVSTEAPVTSRTVSLRTRICCRPTFSCGHFSHL